MTPFVWQDRLVKLEHDGAVFLSRKGVHDDFDFCPQPIDLKNQAIAMWTYDSVEAVDENRLRLKRGHESFILEGDDFSCNRIVPEKPVDTATDSG
jgi:hypothetical protein